MRYYDVDSIGRTIFSTTTTYENLFSFDVFRNPGSDNNIPEAPSGSGVYYSNVAGASPIDTLLQIQSQAYIMVTWNKLGYSPNQLSRINTFQVVVATTNTKTYACYVYPDQESTQNPNGNGGLDWSTDVGSVHVGLYATAVDDLYSFPDSLRASSAGMDGVPGDKPAAIFAGTHGPGLYCSLVSLSESFVILGPAVIASPTNSQRFSASSISSVSFSARGLLDSRDYLIQVNGQSIVSLPSANSGTLATTLDLSLNIFPEGSLLIELVRVSDSSVTASVTIIKDATVAVAFTAPTSQTVINALSPTIVQVAGTGDALGSVTVVAMGSTASTSTAVNNQGIWSSGIDIGGLADGQITLVATITDVAGNQISTTVTITKDTVVAVAFTAPTSQTVINSRNPSILPVAGTGDALGTVAVVATDTRGGTASTSTTVNNQGIWSSGIDIGGLADGQITLVATITDVAGNQRTATVSIIKDATAAVAFTAPTSQTVINALSPSILPVAGTGDALGSVAVVVMGSTASTSTTVNNQGIWSSGIDIGGLADGQITLVATITDVAGNQRTATVTITKDTTSFVTITSPAASSPINKSNFRNMQFAGTGEIGGTVVLSIEDGNSNTLGIQTLPVTVSAGGWRVDNVDVSSQRDGNIRVTATITDQYGNTVTSEPVVLLKKVEPVINITSPRNLQFFVSATRAATVSISGFGDTGIRVYVTVTDQSNRNLVSSTVSMSPVGTWNVVVDVSTLSDGPLTFVATGTDAFESTGTSNIVSLSKDTVLTGYRITSPTPGSSMAQSQARSMLVAGEGEAGGRVSLQIAGTRGVVSKTVAVGETGTWTSTSDVSNLPNGPLVITATGTDQAGNSGALQAVTVTKG